MSVSDLRARARPRERLPVAERREPGFRSRRLLIALSVALCAGEAAVLQGFGIRSGLALAPQVAAPPPYGIFHDLRWIFVYQDGWLWFGGLMAALFAFRASVVTAFVLLAWPRNLPRPSVGKTFLNSLLFVALTVVFMTPAATAAFTTAVTTLWPFYALAFVFAVPVLLLFWYLAFPGWWRRLPPWRPFAWIVLAGVLLTLAGLAVEASPAWVTLVPAALAGIFDALVWYAVADAVAHRVQRAQRQHEPVALRWIATATAGTLAAAAIGFGVAIWTTTPATPAIGATSFHGQPLIDAHGFRSSFDGRSGSPFGSGFVYQRFSYRGLGPNGKPLPYGPRDTYATLATLARKLATQVDALHRQTGKKVDLLGDSEGTLVEKYYLLTHPGAPVAKLVMTSAIVHPARVRYPPTGSNGWGIASRFALERMASFVSAVTFPIGVRVPLVVSLERNAPLLRNGMLCPVPGVAQAAFLPMTSALAEPPPIDRRIPTTDLPRLHGNVATANEEIEWLALTGKNVPHYTAWRIATEIGRDAAASWQVPSLPVGLGWGGGANAATPCRSSGG